MTRAVKPPRTLFVDRPLGFPLGLPNQPELQRQIIDAALGLLSVSELPVIEDFEDPKEGRPVTEGEGLPL